MRRRLKMKRIKTATYHDRHRDWKINSHVSFEPRTPQRSKQRSTFQRSFRVGFDQPSWQIYGLDLEPIPSRQKIAKGRSCRTSGLYFRRTGKSGGVGTDQAITLDFPRDARHLDLASNNIKYTGDNVLPKFSLTTP